MLLAPFHPHYFSFDNNNCPMQMKASRPQTAAQQDKNERSGAENTADSMQSILTKGESKRAARRPIMNHIFCFGIFFSPANYSATLADASNKQRGEKLIGVADRNQLRCFGHGSSFS